MGQDKSSYWFQGAGQYATVVFYDRYRLGSWSHLKMNVGDKPTKTNVQSSVSADMVSLALALSAGTLPIIEIPQLSSQPDQGERMSTRRDLPPSVQLLQLH